MWSSHRKRVFSLISFSPNLSTWPLKAGLYFYRTQEQWLHFEVSSSVYLTWLEQEAQIEVSLVLRYILQSPPLHRRHTLCFSVVALHWKNSSLAVMTRMNTLPYFYHAAGRKIRSGCHDDLINSSATPVLCKNYIITLANCITASISCQTTPPVILYDSSVM